MSLNNSSKQHLERLNTISYFSITDFPLLNIGSKSILNIINKERNIYGLESMVVSDSDIRCIDPSLWINFDQDEVGIYDPDLGICYIKTNPTHMDARQFTINTYQMAHELSHKSMEGDGIMNYSWHLNEGFTDELAQKVMHTLMPPEEGVLLTNEGILMKSDAVWHDMLHITTYGRLDQIYLAKAIKGNNFNVYQGLKFCAFHNKPNHARQLLESAYGKDITEEISKDLLDLGIIREIECFGKNFSFN